MEHGTKIQNVKRALSKKASLTPSPSPSSKYPLLLGGHVTPFIQPLSVSTTFFSVWMEQIHLKASLWEKQSLTYD
jgi:hypothetical protein